MDEPVGVVVEARVAIVYGLVVNPLYFKEAAGVLVAPQFVWLPHVAEATSVVLVEMTE